MLFCKYIPIYFDRAVQAFVLEIVAGWSLTLRIAEILFNAPMTLVVLTACRVFSITFKPEVGPATCLRNNKGTSMDVIQAFKLEAKSKFSVPI